MSAVRHDRNYKGPRTMNDYSTAEMAHHWRAALARFLAVPAWSTTRDRQAGAVAAIKRDLDAIVWLRELHARYPHDTISGVQAMRRLFPGQQWWTSDLREPRDVAYAIRYVELVTGQRLDAAKPLPWWVREWT